MNKDLYVTMTDKFCSGWGPARGLKNKLVFICSNHEQAEIVLNNALSRTDMIHVNIRTTTPYYNSDRFHVEWKTIEEYPNWYKENYFLNQR